MLAFCKIAKIPVEVHEIKVMSKDIRSEEYKKINPMMKVPAIVDTETGLQLAESHAIIRYLAARYPAHAGQWYPQSCPVGRAKIDEYLDYHHLNTRRCANLIFNTLFAKKLGREDPLFNAERARKEVHHTLNLFCENYIGKHKFIAGDQPTAADLSAYYEIQFLYLLKFDFSSWPRLLEWMGEMGKIAEVREANSVFIKLISKTNPDAKI